MATSSVEVAVDAAALLGECPVWHAPTQTLWYCDIPARRLHHVDPASGARDHWDFEGDLGSFAPASDGSVVLALRSGIWRFDPASGGRRQLAIAPYDGTLQRFNDGKCDPAGRFWVGSMDEPRRDGQAALYCFEGGELRQRQGGAAISNGLAWSPDARTMYWTDTKAHTVYAFDYALETGAMSGRRVFARFEGKPAAGLDGYGGRPDGAAVDAEGCYWVAMYEGARVLRLSPAGETLAEVRVPARCPTMPCFGGADLKTVYVTSASIGRPADERGRYPHAGKVFSFRVDVPGQPVGLAQAPPP